MPLSDFTPAATATQSADGKTLNLQDTSNYGSNTQGYTTANFSSRYFTITDVDGAPLPGAPVVMAGSNLAAALALIKDQMAFLVLNLTGQGGVGNYATPPVKIPLDRIAKNLYRNMLQQGCCANRVIDQRLAFADIYFEGCDIEALAGNAAEFNTDIDAVNSYLNGPKF